MVNTSRAVVLQYLVAALAVGVALFLRMLLDPLLGDALPYVTFFGAVIVAAWYGGTAPAVSATVLSFFTADYFFIAPRHSLAVGRLADLVGMVAFFASGSAIALLEGAMRNARLRAEASAADAVARRAELEQVIAERQRAEAARREQEEWLQTTLGSIGDAVIATDTDSQVIFLNRVAAELTGWTPAEATGAALSDVFRILNEHTREPAENPVTKALREGTIVGLANHTVLLARDGTERPIDDSAAPIRSAHGTVLGVVLVFRDITERRRAEAARGELAAIVESSGDAIIGKDLDGQITSWNAAAEHLYGYTAAEVIGTSMAILVPPGEENGYPAIIERLKAGAETERFETTRRRKDGTLIEVSATASPIKNPAGQLVGVSVVARDITARKRAEEALRDSQERLHLAMAGGLMGTWTRELDGSNRVTWTPELEAIFGLESGEFSGTEQAFFDFVHPEDRGPLAQAVAKAIEEHTDYEVEFRFTRKDGDLRWMIGRGRATYDEDGTPLRLAGVGVDITERKRAEEALQEADRRKDEFLAMLAHELRNPLAPITNALQLLEQVGGNPPRTERSLAILRRQVDQLVRLVDDLLDVSRITQGKIKLQPKCVELAGIVARAVETCRPIIDALRHELTVSLPPEPLLLTADPARIEQVLTNLLNNAAKYTEEGGKIWLTVEAEDSHILVRVRDTGIGIAPDLLPRVFDLFRQAERSLDRSQGGLGIGLTLVRQLVEMHGGTVEARSEGVGRGSEFLVRLPISVPGAVGPAGRVLGAEKPSPPSTQHPAPGTDAKRRLRVLVVDDNMDSADSLVMLCQGWGHEAEGAYDGPSALERAPSFRPDIVFLDIGLPGMNGYEVAQALRRTPGLEQTRLVAMTGYGQDEDRRRSQEAGFHHHLTKPIDADAVKELLTQALASDRAPNAERPANPAGTRCDNA